MLNSVVYPNGFIICDMIMHGLKALLNFFMHAQNQKSVTMRTDRKKTTQILLNRYYFTLLLFFVAPLLAFQSLS